MIAISYRREDSTPVAGRLHDRLEADFGKKNVFMDFDSIPYGVDFREQIKQTLERARVVIAIIGPNWFGGRGKGNRRIDDPADFVRLEIATALQRGIPVIPVLLDDTPMPQVESLPADLHALAFRNALMLNTGVDFHHHADRLISGIRELVTDATPAPPKEIAVLDVKAAETSASSPPEKPRIDRRKTIILLSAAALLIVGFAVVDWYVFGRATRTQKNPPVSLAIATPVPMIAETPVATAAASAPATASEASTATPPGTALAAVTPWPTPIPPPPSLAPLPTPFNTVITVDEVRAFVLEHYRATERKDIESMLAHYDDLVDFHADGRRDKAFIRSDFMTYFQRWPVASFTVGDIRVVHATTQNTVTAYFGIRFQVSDPAARRSKQGRANEEWTISKSFGALKIISEKETVHGDTPSYRRSRRY